MGSLSMVASPSRPRAVVVALALVAIAAFAQACGAPVGASPAPREAGELVQLEANSRYTVYAQRRAAELVIVAVNRAAEEASFSVSLAPLHLQEDSWLQPLLTTAHGTGTIRGDDLHATLPPEDLQVWRVMPPRSVAPTPTLAALSVAIGLALVALALVLARLKRHSPGST